MRAVQVVREIGVEDVMERKGLVLSWESKMHLGLMSLPQRKVTPSVSLTCMGMFLSCVRLVDFVVEVIGKTQKSAQSPAWIWPVRRGAEYVSL